MEKKKRTIKLLLFGLRTAVFLVLFLIICEYALYVLTPKQDYGICSIVTYYQQPKGTVDVLVLGTSAAYSDINTNILWEEYGLAVYDLCGAEMPYWIIYYYLKEALKTQKPKLILLDAKPSIYTAPYSKTARVIHATYGIRDPINRIGAIIAATHPDNTLRFICGFPKVHANYVNLTAEDFIYPTNNGGRGSSWKGYIEKDEVLDFVEPTVKWDEEPVMMPENQQYYFEKILKLAYDADIPLLLVGLPTPDYAHDHPYFTGLLTIAEQYGFSMLDYNQPDALPGLDYEVHFADWQHMNIKGSLLLSEQLGKDLLSLYDLPDRRGDAAWGSWQTCTDLWFEKYPEYRPTSY